MPAQLDEKGWAALLDCAREHDVLPLVAFQLVQTGAAGLPDDMRAALRLFLEEQRRRTGKLGKQLRDLLQGMAEAGIPVIPIKGPPLGRRIYGAAWLRTMRHLDMLVHEADVDRAVEVLERAGFSHETGLDRRQRALLRRYAGQ